MKILCAARSNVFDVRDEMSWSRNHRHNHVLHYERGVPCAKRYDEHPRFRCNLIMITLERTNISDNFIFCVSHSGLAKLGE